MSDQKQIEDFYCPPHLKDIFENRLKILFEAVQKDPFPEREVAYRMMVASGMFDPHPGGQFQVILELCVSPDLFIPDGDIHTVTDRQYDQEPYISLPASEVDANITSKVIQGPKERCQYELLVEKHFGIKDKITEDTLVKGLTYGQVVDLVCTADQEFNKSATKPIENRYVRIKCPNCDYMEYAKVVNGVVTFGSPHVCFSSNQKTIENEIE